MAIRSTSVTPIYARPIFWAVMASLAAVVYLYDGAPKPSSKETVARRRNAKPAEAGWEFPEPNKKIHFAKPPRPARNPFAPLAGVEKPAAPAEKIEEDLVQIPSGLADGEGGWAYTGMAEVDGVRMALLENGTSRQMGYVREGETWKKSRVVGINSASIVLADEKGASKTVFRFNPNDPPKPKPEPPGGFRPLDPTGRIGGGSMQIRPFAGNGASPFAISGAGNGSSRIILSGAP